jgi:predicted DNA-binding transcriptional regulator AlpA
MPDDHPRITTREVCALARYSPSTLWKRIDAGIIPAPIDRGGDGFLFDRRAVLGALGIPAPSPAVEPEREITVDHEAIREAIRLQNLKRKGALWRERLAKRMQAEPPAHAPLTPVVDYPVRMTSREVCELARCSWSTLRKHIDKGYMPAALDRGRDGFLFDREAVVRALGLEAVPPAQWATVKRNTNDGQSMSNAVRARRQRALDQSPEMTEKKRAELHAWLDGLKSERAAKKIRRP